MKPNSNRPHGLQAFLLLALIFAAGTGFADGPKGASALVPTGDPAYAQLKQLADAGLLPAKLADAPLTREQVADDIWQAREKYDEIVVAQADMELPPTAPPVEGAEEEQLPTVNGPVPVQLPGAAGAAAGTPAAKAAPTAVPTPDYFHHPEILAQAEKALRTLEQTYQLELDAIMQAKQSVANGVSSAEDAQYALWKSLQAVTNSPSISIHGTGRMFGISQQYYNFGPSLSLANPANRFMIGYLDLEPTAAISKQISWDSIIRLGTSGLPLNGMFVQSAPPYSGINGATAPLMPYTDNNDLGYDQVTVRKITINFSPDFMTMTIGDFKEAYTPFTLWNRDNLDLYYKPEPMDRWDETAKYESFFDEEPAWPFRGLKVGTAVAWPDSDLLDQFKVSMFGHLISNGFNDFFDGGWVFLPNPGNVLDNTLPTNYDTDLIVGGNAELKLRKWYLGDTSWQLSTNVYGVILDDIVDPFQTSLDPNVTNYTGFSSPAYLYYPNDPTTWAHQYRIGSLRPELQVGLGDDIYTGTIYEGAFAEYQDDKFDSARQISDYALRVSPYFQVDKSTITFNYINVGPYFYSPLAQTRQDDITQGSTIISATTALSGMGLYSAPLRSQFFLIDVPRPSGIYSFYDRTQDNVFPYGPGTPNRQGVGLDWNINALKGNALKIAGSAYLVQEITGNLVVNQAGTAYADVDPLVGNQIPIRKFAYLNVGPSFDLGPSVGLKTPMEVGANFRYEQTTSVVGTLTDSWFLGGARVGLFPWWEVAVAYGYQTMDGTDEGYDGTTYARYVYLFDNSDLGSYSPFTVNGNIKSLMWSTTFNIDRNSKAHFDYSLSQGAGLLDIGTLTNQYMEFTYEVKF